jgi:two-component system phosphate regulon sensor histidine kinase PhoR
MDRGYHQIINALITVLRQLEVEREEIESVLNSMAEGIIAVDCSGTIVRINTAAREFIGIPKEKEPSEKNYQQVVKEASLLAILERVLKEKETCEEEISPERSGDVVLRVYAKPLYNNQQLHIGALLVLNDISRIVRLENVRRDFVANVSHELKTPITSIKGFVETLLDGAMHCPSDLKKFLEIISRQSDRVTAIFDDLLTLSRIEQDRGKISLQRGKLKDVIRSACLACEHKAEDKEIKLEIDCEKQLFAMINAPLLEQAIVNLVDNAIKYSGNGSLVLIKAYSQRNEKVIAVCDNGPGIDSVHHERLFERFYRVDKARSRIGGGTGLGLAIVKHIAQAHGGYPGVESTPGKGSSFYLHLPQ